MESSRRDPYRYFRIEARELVDQLNAGLLGLESAQSVENLRLVLRVAHTLKGAARVVRQKKMADLVHGLEDTLAPYRDQSGAVPRAQITAALAALDQITTELAALPPAETPALPASPTAAATVRTVRAELADVDALLTGLSEIQSDLGAMRSAAGDAERARRLAASLSSQLSSLRTGDGRLGSAAPATTRLRAMADELHRTLSGMERRVGTGTEQIEGELREAREQAERLRLVSAAVVFVPLQRVVRETANGAGKRAMLHTSGADIRLDSDMLDAVQSALVQMTTNAVVHGIEAPARRTAAGKPAEGRVSIDVARDGQHVVFRVVDDGAGVDLDAVRRTIERRGETISRDADATELLRVLLRGGLSTATVVTGMSGRGVGLDIVRDTAERFGGEVRVDTRAGGGTTVELRVLPSLVAIRALVVESNGSIAAVPMEVVRGAKRVQRDDVTRGTTGDSISHNDARVPLVPLSELLARDTSQASHHDIPVALSAVLVGNDRAVAALAVDRLVGAQTIVLRPALELAPMRTIVSGLYVDGDGQPRPVLDIAALPRHIAATTVLRELPSVRRRPILVIDDSLTTRMLEQSILEAAGYDVVTATSAEEGLVKARSGNFGLFLVDVEMPGMDGFTFVETYHRDAALRDVPSILVTSRDAQEDRERGATAGASGYIVKGAFDQTEFLNRVAELLQS